MSRLYIRSLNDGPLFFCFFDFWVFDSDSERTEFTSSRDVSISVDPRIDSLDEDPIHASRAGCYAIV